MALALNDSYIFYVILFYNFRQSLRCEFFRTSIVSVNLFLVFTLLSTKMLDIRIDPTTTVRKKMSNLHWNQAAAYIHALLFFFTFFNDIVCCYGAAFYFTPALEFQISLIASNVMLSQKNGGLVSVKVAQFRSFYSKTFSMSMLPFENANGTPEKT